MPSYLLVKQLKALMIPRLGQKLDLLADPKVSKEECFEGVPEDLLLKTYFYHLNFHSIQNSIIIIYPH